MSLLEFLEFSVKVDRSTSAAGVRLRLRGLVSWGVGWRRRGRSLSGVRDRLWPVSGGWWCGSSCQVIVLDAVKRFWCNVDGGFWSSVYDLHLRIINERVVVFGFSQTILRFISY